EKYPLQGTPTIHQSCYFSVFCFPAALSSVLQVLGGVLHILHNNCCHLEMCVDSWPTFSHTETKMTYGLFQIGQTLKRLLLNERVVNWRNGLRFRGCVLKKIIKNVHSAFNRFIYITPPHIKLPVSTLTRKLLPLPISILHESHAELVDRHLPYGGSQENLEHVRACIRHLPNLCVTDDKGQPVSWILSDELCELRMAYTLPEYRRAGHLTALSQALIRRMSSLGLPVYCHIHQQNQGTINAVNALGSLHFPTKERISVLLICRDRV
uniref:Glycine N-acyltransferase-like protein n=1 Tax=Myripristis murdjan TaxID=586833 RepID=A0A667WI68_9TELE